jgi:phosphoglucomutase
MSDVLESRVQKWLKGNFDAETKKQISSMNELELKEAFYKDLEFGTGGLRGLMGAGTNRMNIYTVAMATQGLANYLKLSFPNQNISVAIAHDCRNNSNKFAKITADVFSANGIKVYLFPALRPTPLLSYTIRELKCKSGVVITASHNPKEYNGYKAYWEDGAQLTSPHDKNVITEVQKITSIDEVKMKGVPSLIEILDERIENAYFNQLESIALLTKEEKRKSNLKIVFSSIHGTGITMVPKALERFGFENVHIVKEQENPDGNFSTVVYPNPEEKEAMDLSLKLAQKVDADIVLATDPDADRVGVAIKNLNGEFELLNGNQTGSLLLYYLMDRYKEKGILKGNEYVVKTIVTTYLIDKIAKDMGVDCYNTLTGFKYIASVIRENETVKQYIAGCEESYGYLVGDFVRDKDGIGACALIAEMSAWAKNNGKSLFEIMIEMYVKFGFYKEHLVSITKKGISGSEEIAKMMADFRKNPPKVLGGEKIANMYDYKLLIITDVKSGKTKALDFLKSDVLQFETENGSMISVRPSGTEPKIKFYFSICEKLDKKENYSFVNSKLINKIEQIISDLNL